MNNHKNIASPYLRLLAYLIDICITIMPALLIIVLVSTSNDITLVLSRASLFALLLIYPVFTTVLTSLMISEFGGTFGKLLTGTSIVRSDGSNLSFWRATWRNLIGYTVSGLILWAGFIWILVDKNRQGWHDMMADSYVVVKNKLMWIIGLVVLMVTVYVQISLVKTSIRNFKSNANVYTETYMELQSEMEDEAEVTESF